MMHRVEGQLFCRICANDRAKKRELVKASKIKRNRSEVSGRAIRARRVAVAIVVDLVGPRSIAICFHLP